MQYSTEKKFLLFATFMSFFNANQRLEKFTLHDLYISKLIFQKSHFFGHLAACKLPKKFE
jgi:hypothetical protein